MKRFLIALLFISTVARSQNLPFNSEGAVEYTEVISVDSLSDERLYSNSKIFIAEAFKSAKDVTRLQDDASKTVVVKGIIPTHVKLMNRYWNLGHSYLTIKVSCKDSRYKYTVSNIIFRATNNQGVVQEEIPIESTKTKIMASKKNWKLTQEAIDADIKELILELKKAMLVSDKEW